MEAKAYDPDYLNEIIPRVEDGKGDPQGEHGEGVEPPVVLSGHAMRIWRGEEPCCTDAGQIDRSSSLFKIGGVLLDAGATRSTVVGALKERDSSLGWKKYALRGDAADRYGEIFDELEGKAKSGNVYDLGEHKKNGGSRSRQSDPRFGNRVMLDEIMREGVEDPEELVEGVLLKGKVHQLYADAGSGKSWTALGLASKVMEQGKTVVYLDKENGPRTMTERLNLLGVEPEKARELFFYYPDPTASGDEGSRHGYEEMLDQDEPDLVIFDSWIGFLSDADLNENESSDIQKWARWYLQPARRRGITTLVLDHVPHGTNRSRGSGRKKEEVDVQWELYRSMPFDRSTVGKITLRRKKDREGWLPSKVAFEMGGGSDGFVFERLRSVGEDPRGKVSENQQKILRVLRDKFNGHVPTDGEWKKACDDYEGVPFSSYYNAKKKLIEMKFVEEKGKGFFYLESGEVISEE